MMPIKNVPYDESPIPPIFGINSMTGVGKTSAAGEVIRDLLPYRPSATSIYIAAPTHTLAEELAMKLQEDYQDEGISVMPYRGLAADDPENPGMKMCRIADDAERLRQGGADIRCLCAVKRDGEDIFCPHFDVCGYQRQKGYADVRIVPHNLMAYKRPSFLYGAAALIVDESTIGALITGLDGPPQIISLFDIGASRRVPFVEGNFAKDEVGTKFLNGAKASIARRLNEHPTDEPISTSIIAGAGLSLADILYARDLLLRCNSRISLSPDMTDGKRRNAVEIAKDNQRLFIEARFWALLARAVENDYPTVPGFRIELNEKSKDRYPVVRLRWREEIHTDWNVPTLLMDATADWDMVRCFWPIIDRIEKFDAATPHTTVRQVMWSGSKAKLIGDTDTQHNNRQRVHRYVEARSTEFDRVLVICQKSLEIELIGLGLPSNVSLGHFNGMRGIDRHGDVDCLIVIGRTQPQPDQTEMIAEVLFGSVPQRGPEWDGSYYPRRPVGLNMHDPNAVAEVDAEYHPDDNAEAVRWAACEGELIQSIGRGRPVNRTQNNPLQIDIVGTISLPINVDEVVEWNEAQANPFELMFARGIIPDCDRSTKGYWGVVAAILPDRFKDAQAAKDWGRTLTVESTNKYIPISESHCEGCRRASVTVNGARYKVSVLIKCGDADPRAFAEKVMGPLDRFELDGEPSATLNDDQPVNLEPPFDLAPPLLPPVDPQPPVLVGPNSPPLAVEVSGRETPEDTWRRVIAGLVDEEWPDPDSAGLEATRLWLEARQDVRMALGRTAFDVRASVTRETRCQITSRVKDQTEEQLEQEVHLQC